MSLYNKQWHFEANSHEVGCHCYSTRVIIFSYYQIGSSFTFLLVKIESLTQCKINVLKLGLSGLIWVQKFCKSFQQMTLVGKRLTLKQTNQFTVLCIFWLIHQNLPIPTLQIKG